MARSVSYRHQISDIANWNQIKASNETLFILREIGPVGFVVQEEGHKLKYKVCLGDPHSCSCKEFQSQKDLCKHICWILLKKFKVDKNDPISWQLGLVQREINDLIFSKHIKKNKIMKNNEEETKEITPDKPCTQRKIELDDVCPICQDDLMNSAKPVTFCRNGCGNNIHIRCMSVWTEHKKKELNLKMQDSIPCPVCRGEFATMHLLMVEMTNSKEGKIKQKSVLQVKQNGLVCANCNINPIIGKAYKCKSCSHYYLCSTCFNNYVHRDHEFGFREHSNGKWLNAPSTRGVPESLINGLQNNDLDSTNYGLLQQLDKPVNGSPLRQQDINQFSTWTVSLKSKLSQPGHQCRICLMSYILGDIVRKLPRCQHIFHTLCIDPWLIHRTPHCPIDDIEVTKLSLNTNSSHNKHDHPELSVNHSNSFSINSVQNRNSNDINKRFHFNQPQGLTSALSIASINCRPLSSSDGLKSSSYSMGSLVKSAMSKPRHLPPISMPTNHHFDSAFSITAIKMRQDDPQK